MHELKHELVWKEAVSLILIVLFSFAFYFRSDQLTLYLGFILLSLVFYTITVSEENDKGITKNMREYFMHTSSYFVLALTFFVISFVLLKFVNTGFLMITLAIAVILFSVGFMRLLFSRFVK